jgi:hypothetical protein
MVLTTICAPGGISMVGCSRCYGPMGWRFVNHIQPNEPICNRTRMDSEGNIKNYYSQILFLPSLEGESVTGVVAGGSRYR